ncbi:MAG TPA: ATP phosphoribosyltransferase regulatory subunit [Gammaproteobacteria bacterium]|nr:ATP phosphoribosyltransferase regulatory subunit [Gammaproteobacteria bacterium]HDZ78997.1 ATP phosphoribosyltransferase regulatory subunit [Gammaproteobacteria bacterium]
MSNSNPSLSNGDRWLLPVGVEETLPVEAARIERLRRIVLDLLDSWGYDLVMPPLMEYLDSLLTGAGHGLEIETFKLTDQMSGRMMGVRADMTPQVARIDAHYLHNDGANRLCYLGPVLRTRPDCLGCSRVPLQLGAELFGVKSYRADIEIVELLVETLHDIGLENLHVDLGHMGIFQALAAAEDLDAETQGHLVKVISSRAGDDVAQLCQALGLSGEASELFISMTDSSGEVDSLPGVVEKYTAASEEVKAAVQNLSRIACSLKKRLPATRLYYDLAELKGKSYHNGLVFSVYTQGSGRAIANGGRYDDIGIDFGRARPATGFSLDLRAVSGLIKQSDTDATASYTTICAPDDDDPALFDVVKQLRQDGRRVVFYYDKEQADNDYKNAANLVRQAGKWIVQ